MQAACESNRIAGQHRRRSWARGCRRHAATMNLNQSRQKFQPPQAIFITVPIVTCSPAIPINIMEPESSTSPSVISSPVVFDSAVLLGLRLVYFLLSRRFLLSTINPTLRDLSKSESQLLPATVSQNRSPASQSPSLRAQDLDLDGEFDTEDDGLLSANSPAPSYPSTPTRGTVPLPGSSRAPYRSSPPGSSTNLAGDAGVEMHLLGQKLRDAGKKQVIQLTHARTVGTKRSKNATRGLNRVSRVLFSLCLAEGCNLLTLVIFHAVGILHSR